MLNITYLIVFNFVVKDKDKNSNANNANYNKIAK